MAAVSTKLLFSRVGAINVSRDVVLGSGSPRRKEILGDMLQFAAFRVAKPSFEENLSKEGISAADYTLQTSMGKAESLMGELGPRGGGDKNQDNDEHKPRIVICADTVVDLDGRVLEKPSNAAHAEQMLMSLQGREHCVHTSVVICADGPADGGLRVVASFVESAVVKFCAFDRTDIRAYIATGEGEDKAGAYGIQGRGCQLVESVSGDYFAVMGLPAHRLGHMLAELWDAGSI